MKNSKLKRSMAAALLATSSLAAEAMDENLQNCRHRNGISMPADECAVFQRAARETDAAAERSKAQLEEARAANAAWQKERDDKAAQSKAENDERARQEQFEMDARRKAYQAEREADDRRFEQSARQARVREELLKSTCGTDYQNPKIGMSIDRALQCVGRYRLTAQINRADGVVTTYTGKAGYLHVMGGRIVSWGR